MGSTDSLRLSILLLSSINLAEAAHHVLDVEHHRHNARRPRSDPHTPAPRTSGSAYDVVLLLVYAREGRDYNNYKQGSIALPQCGSYTQHGSRSLCLKMRFQYTKCIIALGLGQTRYPVGWGLGKSGWGLLGEGGGSTKSTASAGGGVLTPHNLATIAGGC